ncbi:type VII secretion protein EccB [Micromonospora echinofusca]|uniref:Type VII secretion protein EccB n=1 Tax=Micromonospora echinofusca TaxID=47858 RepID=A0ABS3VWU4_MICEH|nr:type VII secretion protein EccB [Micromonospora echinofusca]MBO4209026.1 type VII secretion protein EccB [Micromonospora echinofusca]
MQSRRDQAQAHAFVMSRLVSALLRAEPDAPITPLHRFLVGALCGLLLGGLLLVGFGVYGFFVPGGSKAWRKPGVLVVEKETGARYVVVDGVLRPVLNYTSARLILGGTPKVVTVSRNSLRDAPHGLPVGILAAPDHLPDRKRLNANQWRVCSASRADAVGRQRPYVTLEAGSAMAVRAAAADEALVVRTPANQSFVTWNNQRLRVPNPAMLGALGYSAATVRQVGWAWINAVPAGPDLVPEPIPGRGSAGPRIDGRATLVGQLFKVPAVAAGDADQFFVVRVDGLSPLTAVGAALLLAARESRAAYPAGRVAMLDLSPAALAQSRLSAISSINDSLPARPPRLLQIGPGEAPCLRIGMKAAGPEVSVGVAAATTSAGPSLGGGADQVVISPGSGLLLRDQPGPDVAEGTRYLLVDSGVRYPIPSDKVTGVLGYGGLAPMPVPGPILALLPVGQPLDPEAARATVPFTTPGLPGRVETDGPEGSGAAN